MASSGFFPLYQHGKTFIATGHPSVQAFNMSLGSPAWYDMLEDPGLTSLNMSGETGASWTDMLHPNHEVMGGRYDLRYAGPNTAAPSRVFIDLIKPGDVFPSKTLTQNFTSLNLSGSQFAIHFNFVFIWGWRTNEFDEDGDFNIQLRLQVPNNVNLSTLGKTWTMTDLPTGGFNGFKKGADSPGHLWLDETTDQIHYIDANQIEHTIPNTGGSVSAPGSDPGQIYIDSLVPRLGFTSNERRFLTKNALLETDSAQAGLPILRQTALEVGYLHVTSGTRRLSYLQLTATNPGTGFESNHLLCDGSDF